MFRPGSIQVLFQLLLGTITTTETVLNILQQGFSDFSGTNNLLFIFDPYQDIFLIGN